MSAPRAPRKATGNVDAQLHDFEQELDASLEHVLLYHVNLVYWNDMNHISDNDRARINAAIDVALLDLTARYEDVTSVRTVLELARILFRNVVWAAMNVPFPADPRLHVEYVIDNLMEVYTLEIYANLRTEMIMANHHAHVLQRTWRRCITNPSHPACKRRLEYEFKECAL